MSKPIQFLVTEDEHRKLGVLAAEKDSSRAAIAKVATLSLLPQPSPAKRARKAVKP